MRDQHNDKKQLLFTRTLLLLYAIEGIIIFFLLVVSKSDVENRVLGFYSTPRLIELFLFGLFVLVTLLLSKKSLSSNLETQRIIHFLKQRGWKEFFFFISIFLVLINQAAWVVLNALSKNPDSYYFAGYANHLRPIFVFFTLLGIEFAVWMILVHRDHLWALLIDKKKTLHIFLMVSGGMSVLSLLSLYVLSNYRENILKALGGPAVPLLEWQIFLAWLLGTLVMLFGTTGKFTWLQRPGWVAWSIWFLTIALWLVQPIKPGFAATAPIEPNFEVYPFSDAQLYAQNSQSIVIGKGMAGEEFPARPLYVVFLAMLHGVVGQSYTYLIAAQTLFLAFFPVVLYLLGREIAGPPLGVALAVLAIFRDITMNQVAPFTVSVTYSKLFLSELPVALLLSLCTLVILRWLKMPSQAKYRPLIAGGILGLTTLIRTQSIIAIVPLLLILLLLKDYTWKKKATHFSLFILGVALSLSPWLFRNWQHTGGIVIDNPLSQMNVIAVRYSEYGEMVIPHLPGENHSEYSARMLGIVVDSFLENPQKIFRSVLSHFLQNETGNLLVFPVRRGISSLHDLWFPTSNFWEDWNTSTTVGKYVLIPFYLLIISVGITMAWKKVKWLGIFPLALNAVYNGWTALFLTSGIRFVFPTDWVFYLYGILGLLTITSGVFVILDTFKKVDLSPSMPQGSLPIRQAIPAILLIFVAGLSLPASEYVVPDQYPQKTQSEMWQSFEQEGMMLEDGYDTAVKIIDLAEEENLSLYEGRILYPRFYDVNEGIQLTDKPGFKPVDQARVVMRFVGQRNGRIIFPIEKAPTPFPHAVDATIIVANDSLEEIWAIMITYNNENFLYTNMTFQESIK